MVVNGFGAVRNGRQDMRPSAGDDDRCHAVSRWLQVCTMMTKQHSVSNNGLVAHVAVRSCLLSRKTSHVHRQRFILPFTACA
eukprot:scaffold287_cov337-Pavlova_lutheri.AAC.33